MSDDPFSTDSPNPDSSAASNPYAPTSQTPGTAVGEVDPSDFEAYRKAHLSHEASVKSLGCLYYIGAAFGVMFGIGYIGIAAAGGDPELPSGVFIVIGIVMLGIGIAQGFIAHGIRNLRPWARIAGIVLSVIGLLGIPIGTLISAYFLYLLISRKGEIVFSEYYQYIISQTPHIVYKTSIIVKILVGILIVVFSLAVVALIFGG